LSAPEPVTNREFTKILGKVLHRPSWITVPAFALKLVLGEMSTLVIDGQRVIPQRLLESGYRFSFDRLAPALEDLLGKQVVER